MTMLDLSNVEKLLKQLANSGHCIYFLYDKDSEKFEVRSTDFRVGDSHRTLFDLLKSLNEGLNQEHNANTQNL